MLQLSDLETLEPLVGPLLCSGCYSLRPSGHLVTLVSVSNLYIIRVNNSTEQFRCLKAKGPLNLMPTLLIHKSKIQVTFLYDLKYVHDIYVLLF